MKVKIYNVVNDKVHDGTEYPIMVILTEQDKKNIANMKGKRYCLYPDTKEWTDNNYEKIEAWMRRAE